MKLRHVNLILASALVWYSAISASSRSPLARYAIDYTTPHRILPLDQAPTVCFARPIWLMGNLSFLGEKLILRGVKLTGNVITSGSQVVLQSPFEVSTPNHVVEYPTIIEGDINFVEDKGQVILEKGAVLRGNVINGSVMLLKGEGFRKSFVPMAQNEKGLWVEA